MAKCDPSDSGYLNLLATVEANEEHFKSDESEAGQRLHCGSGALKDGLLQIASEDNICLIAQ